METNPFNPSKPESDPASESESTSSSKKKKKLKLPLFESGDEPKQAKEASEAEKPKLLEAPESLWKRLMGTPAEEKPAPDTDNEKTAATLEATEGITPVKAEILDAESSLEELTEAEQAAVAEQYIQARLVQLAHEQNSPAEEIELSPAEQAADKALLEALQDRLLRDQETTVQEQIESTYAETANRLAAAAAEVAGAETNVEYERPALDQTVPAEARQPASQATARTPEAPIVGTTPTAPRAETVRVAQPSEIYENRTGSALLIGGTVGYLIGRRHGRLKTEKAMKSLEKTLTHKVENLEQTIWQKEQQIRSLVREQVPARDAGNAEKRREPVTALPAKEKLGLVSLKAMEAAPGVGVSKQELKPAKKPEPERSASVQTLAREELLQASEAVAVGSTNLRRVYETHLITEQGLRRLVEAHVRGADIRALLEREMVEKELSYERDPRLRDQGVTTPLTAGSAGKVLDESGLSDAVEQKVAIAHKDTAAARDASAAQNRRRQPVAAYVTVITLTLVIALLLYVLFTSN